ncbi:MAG: 5'/3'-nucleotidase SurE [Alphaproteobacteria bacterium]|nr:5'/3'-nucleotidase SurE [Alphaproteobacteria bacterium]
MLRILITNDDGYNADGIELLYRLACNLSSDVWVIAPESDQSGCGHSVTLQRPLYITQHATQRFSINGTPTDCVMLAINEIMLHKKPDLVLSGINRGANLGDDVLYSGTVSAGFEAMLSGINSICLSQYYTDTHPLSWDFTQEHGLHVLRHLLLPSMSEPFCLNVNFPAGPSKGIKRTSLGKRKIGGNLISHLDEFNQRCFTIGKRRIEDNTVMGTDIHAVYGGYTSITPLCLGLTDHATLLTLTAEMGD